MRELRIDDLNALRNALDDVIGYLADNSCSDPDCCGGPFYDEEDFDDGVQVLEAYGLFVNEATVLLNPPPS